MIIILALLTIAMAIIYAMWRTGQDASDIRLIAIIFTAVLTTVYSIAIGVSYKTYVDTRVSYNFIHKQYRDAIVMYKDRAVIDTEKAFTDFKYKGYQDNISSFIKDLRDQIVSYNKITLGKKVLKCSPFLNWFIYAPDSDMKPLALMGKK